MICSHRFFTTSASSLFLFLLFLFGFAKGQEMNQTKEPPIPVVIGSNGENRQFPDEESITLSVSDFNHIMQREDSLRSVFAEQTAKLESNSGKKSLAIDGLLALLVISNLFTLVVTRKRSYPRIT